MLKGDHNLLDRRLMLLQPRKRDPARAHYKKLFLEAMDQEPIEYKKASAGRRAANLWVSMMGSRHKKAPDESRGDHYSAQGLYRFMLGRAPKQSAMVCLIQHWHYKSSHPGPIG